MKLNIGRFILFLGCIGYWMAMCGLMRPLVRTDIHPGIHWVGVALFGSLAAAMVAIVVGGICGVIYMLPEMLRKLKDWLYGY